MVFGIIRNGVAVNAIEVDMNDYAIEDIQQFAEVQDDLVAAIPDGYGIADFYDIETNQWTKAPVPMIFDGDEWEGCSRTARQP